MTTVVCEEKHMGSRAVFVVCRDEAAAQARFRVGEGEVGAVYTRTGRPFFREPALQRALLDRLRAGLSAAGLWDELGTDWVCLDAELLPWSAKARELLERQYAAVGAAGELALERATEALAKAPAAAALLERTRGRLDAIRKFREVYRRYSWNVPSIDDYRVAPFHLLASEGKVHADRDHEWHMTTLGRLADHAPIVRRTPYLRVELADGAATDAAVRFWDELTAAGGEGMVVKPLSFVARGPRGLVQPALKCRGREYLRLIYGPDYLAPQHLEALRPRSLSTKRSLALREFALGLEALHRFTEREPLHRVHECVFGVLAMESVPVDPRL